MSENAAVTPSEYLDGLRNGSASRDGEVALLNATIRELRDENRAMRQALTWCVVNNGETLGDHPKLLERFQQILGMEADA